MTSASYDLVVVGTGFASTFFLLEYLRHARSTARVLVLERGQRFSPEQRNARSSASLPGLEELIINRTPEKPWVQNIGFGGGTCWLGNAPRPHPSDFETRSRYGVGEDWPIGYAEIEPFLSEAEDVMGISGAPGGPFPRSRPYPGRPHKLNAFDRMLAQKFPDLHLPMPSARSSGPETGRATCCTTTTCSHCPITAKFQVDPHLAHVYSDPRVELRLEHTVRYLDMEAGRVTGVHYEIAGEELDVRCELVALGAHGIFNAHILLRSGLEDFALGRYLSEGFSVDVQLNLDGLESLDGSQVVTGIGLMFHDGGHRHERATCNVESWNAPWLRAERGRWRQRAFLKFIFEDLPAPHNRVRLSPEDDQRPEVEYPELSDYTRAGIDAVPELVEELIDGLPVEDYVIADRKTLGTEAHIQGTARMGRDSATSVVDRELRHHRVRNLLVLGSSAFPTCPAANPTLLLSALSLWAGRRLFA